MRREGETFGLRVQRARRQRQISQATLAEWAGVCQQTISKIEQARDDVGEDVRERVASLLEIRYP